MKQTSQKETVTVSLPVEFLKHQLAKKLDGVNNLLVDCIVETCDNKEALMHVLLGTLEEPKFSVGDMVYCTDTYYHRPEGAESGTYVEYGDCVVIGVNPFNQRYRYEVQQVVKFDDDGNAIVDDGICQGKKTNCRESHLIPIELVESLGLAE
jgi:hypothetical protein